MYSLQLVALQCVCVLRQLRQGFRTIVLHSFYIYIQSGDSGHILKVLKQLLCVDGIVYMLQEIYGLENKSKQEEHNSVSAVLLKQMLLCKL